MLGLNLTSWFEQPSQQQEEERSQGTESRFALRYDLAREEQELHEYSLAKLG